MGHLKRKGEAGAAKAYTTRTAAVKKLQCSLADFRRLCILKGVFPREPRSRKRANKGSSAPTSFYYAKDIAYLAHEPVLQKLREHKSFAKKLARALGKGEWGSAKALEDNKPVYCLDHIIKERYPTFVDAVRDIDDALCMVFLFACLPSTARVSPSLIENCARLSAEWELYVAHSKLLRKAFLSIKGVYFQAEIIDQTVTWLVPYRFPQIIPSDVDVRVMLTFLELYQTLLRFVFFKLYTDIGLVYPPPLDTKKDENAIGFGALILQEKPRTIQQSNHQLTLSTAKTISGKDVRHAIKSISANANDVEPDVPDVGLVDPNDVEEGFVPQPSKSDPQTAIPIPTLHSLSSLPPTFSTSLFSPYTFFLSREISRPIFQFLIQSFGGRVSWPATPEGGSPFPETDASITHVIIDRPLVINPHESEEEGERRLKRKWVQPQWVVDCINAGKILLEEPYWQGKTLLPHLSPFGEYEGAYDPTAAPVDDEAGVEDGSVIDIVDNETEVISNSRDDVVAATVAAAAASDDPAALRAAELAAEAAGVDYGKFEKEISKTRRKLGKSSNDEVDAEKDMNKMMMSNKRKKLYERMKFTERKRAKERLTLEEKKRALRRLQRDRII